VSNVFGTGYEQIGRVDSIVYGTKVRSRPAHKTLRDAVLLTCLAQWPRVRVLLRGMRILEPLKRRLRN